MDTEVIVALIAVLGTLVGSVVTAISGLTLIRHRLNSVEKKLDEHNGYSRMFAEAHEDIAIIKVDIQYLKERINDFSERR